MNGNTEHTRNCNEQLHIFLVVNGSYQTIQERWSYLITQHTLLTSNNIPTIQKLDQNNPQTYHAHKTSAQSENA